VWRGRLARDGESLGMLDLIAYVDGGSRGNPGPAGVGVVIDGAESGRITITKWIGHQDNNVAEYLALLEALQCAVNLKARKLHVYSDSQVVVRQMLGAYNCRSERLYSLNWICRKLARSLEFTISHIRRESNVEANGLATAAAAKSCQPLRNLVPALLEFRALPRADEPSRRTDPCIA